MKLIFLPSMLKIRLHVRLKSFEKSFIFKTEFWWKKYKQSLNGSFTGKYEFTLSKPVYKHENALKNTLA
jgi:hypothetical protein